MFSSGHCFCNGFLSMKNISARAYLSIEIKPRKQVGIFGFPLHLKVVTAECSSDKLCSQCSGDSLEGGFSKSYY